MEENKLTPDFKVVLIGGSAGSLEVLLQVIPKLVVLKNFALVIVLHRKSTDDATLEELLSLKTNIPVHEIEDKTPLIPGDIYVAPADYHLLFEKSGVFSLDISEKINYSRPSIDVCFESAAEAFSQNVIGILLSGANADGTEGLKAIKEAGGIVIIQDPNSASMPYMPKFAVDHVEADAVFDVNEILNYILKINL